MTLASIAFATVSGLLSSTVALLIVHELRLPPTYIGIPLGAAAIAAFVARVPVGGGIDRFGAKWFGAAGPLLAGLGAVLIAVARPGQIETPLAADLPLLLTVGSLVWGAGIGSFSTASNTYVANTVPPARRAEAFGYFGIGMTLGQGAGAGGGYSIATTLGFPALYGVAAAVGVVGFVLMATLQEVRAQRQDVVRRFLGVETTVLAPTFGLLTLTTASGIALSAVPLLGPARGIPNPGLYFLALALASIAGRLTGRLADRRGRLVVIVPGMLLAALGQAIAMQASSGLAIFLAGLAFGLGFSLAQFTLLALAIDLAGPGRRGAGVATFTAAADVGILVGTNLGAVLLATASFSGVFALAAAAPIIGAMVIVLARRGRGQASPRQ